MINAKNRYTFGIPEKIRDQVSRKKIEISLIELPTIKDVIKNVMLGIKTPFWQAQYDDHPDLTKMDKLTQIDSVKEYNQREKEFLSQKDKEKQKEREKEKQEIENQ